VVCVPAQRRCWLLVIHHARKISSCKVPAVDESTDAAGNRASMRLTAYCPTVLGLSPAVDASRAVISSLVQHEYSNVNRVVGAAIGLGGSLLDFAKLWAGPFGQRSEGESQMDHQVEAAWLSRQRDAPSCTNSPTDGTDENGLSSIAHYQRRTCDPCHRSTRGAEGRFPQVPASQAQGRLRSLRSLDPLSQDQGPSTGRGPGCEP
jgi:hypothetical protein